MARLDLMGEMIGPVVVGVASAAANVVEKQANRPGATGPQLFKQASLWGDVAIGAYAIFNHMQDLGFPRGGNASLATAGAGVALLSRRATDWIGATFLQLPTGSRHTSIPGAGRPARYRPSLRSPGAAVETGILPRKRQFFSVT